MKANGAPEKLYLHPTAKGKVGASWLTFPLTNEDIEYTRTDAFIEKVCEVDLEKEVERFVQTKEFAECDSSPVMVLAKHFFELGMSASNPITATDRGTAEEIIVNLKRVEQDYHINLTREMEWLRNKVKKGEEV